MTNYKLKIGARQKGFTLIEMSIVLVIIGLIIGGILKGQELIESSRQKNFISQVDGYRAAVTTFTERFNAMPGDFNCATDAGACGAGGGKIAATNAQIINGGGNGIAGVATYTTAANMFAAPADAANSEELQFWVHLNAANLIGGVAPLNVAPVAFGGENAIPASAFPSSGFSEVYGNYDSTTPKQTHWLKLKRTANGAGTAALSPKQMYNVDNKMDDGVPGAGTFRTDAGNAACGTIAGVLADYTVVDETIRCMAVIQLVQ